MGPSLPIGHEQEEEEEERGEGRKLFIRAPIVLDYD
jgi:hypothetical protein